MRPPTGDFATVRADWGEPTLETVVAAMRDDRNAAVAKAARAAYELVPPKPPAGCAADVKAAYDAAKGAYDRAKAQAFGLVVSGEWTYRSLDADKGGVDNWRAPSGLAFYDFDGLRSAGLTPGALLEMLEAQAPKVMSACALAFPTISADGLRLIAAFKPIPRTPAEHRAAWDAGAELLRAALPNGVSLDKAGNAAPHFTYVSYCPDAALREFAPMGWAMPEPKAAAAADRANRADRYGMRRRGQFAPPFG